MWKLLSPTDADLQSFLKRQERCTWSYSQLGGTMDEVWPTGYDHDRNRVCLGRGKAAFELACRALRSWKQFPLAWTSIYPANAPLQVGCTVAMTARVLSQWWINACRIVYVIDEKKPSAEAIARFGFAYGTLQEHVESGEEQFLIEQLADGSVWYVLSSFSRPRLWCVRMAYPWVRRLQRQFVRDSLRGMHDAVNQAQMRHFDS